LSALKLRPVELERAHIESSAMHAGALRVELEHHLSEAVMLETLLVSASGIAESLAGLRKAKRDPVAAEKAPQSPHVAEQRAAALGIGDEGEWPFPWGTLSSFSVSTGAETGGGWPGPEMYKAASRHNISPQ
jgi:hypothetical protein